MKLLHRVLACVFCASALSSHASETLLNAQLECAQQKCHLDLIFASAKPNPALKLNQDGSSLSLTLSGLSDLRSVEQRWNSGPLHSFRLVAGDKKSWVFQLKGSDLKWAGKPSPLGANGVRFPWTSSSKQDFKAQVFSQTAKSTEQNPPVAAKKNMIWNTKADSVVWHKYVEQRKGSAKEQVKSSKSFSLAGPTTAQMAFIKDAPVYVQADIKSKVLAAGQVGKCIERISFQNEWVRVRWNGGSGYVLRGALAYLDETPAEVSKVLAKQNKKDIQARLTLNTAAQKDSLRVPSMAEVAAKVPMNQKSTYSSYGRRDPFVPVKLAVAEGLSVDEVRLVGIIWSDKNPIAIFEDVKMPERNYSLSEGDPIMNGRIVKITRDEVVFSLTDYGVTRKFAMSLPKIEP